MASNDVGGEHYGGDGLDGPNQEKRLAMKLVEVGWSARTSNQAGCEPSRRAATGIWMGMSLSIR